LRPLKPVAPRRASLIRPEEISPVDVEIRVLENGLRLVSEHVVGSGSVGIALNVGAGSRHEKRDESGIAHFIEHLVFKGTEGRSMREIMRSVESRGGMLNAFTTKEHTCYYAWTRSMYMAEALDVLHELAFRPIFDAREIERERAVIIEEIHGIEDEADEMVFDAFEETLFGKHPLAKPVIGREITVEGLDRNAVSAFHRAYYRPSRVSIVATGAHSHEEFFSLAAKLIGKEKEKDGRPRVARETMSYKTGKDHTILCKGISQAHIVLGIPAPSILSPDLPAVQAIVTALGVGMSSRLSLRLREELALAYDTMAFYTPYSDAGCIGVYAAMTEEESKRGREEMQKIIAGIVRKPISHIELDRVKDQIIGGMVLSMESISTRLMRTGQSEMYHKRYIPIEEEIAKIAALTLPQIRAKTEEYFGDEKRLTVVSTRSN
jgi:predicted Zn-dependent peptidase